MVKGGRLTSFEASLVQKAKPQKISPSKFQTSYWSLTTKEILQQQSRKQEVVLRKDMKRLVLSLGITVRIRSYFSKRNVGMIKEERDQTKTCHDFHVTKWWKIMAYCGVRSLITAKFIFYVYFTKMGMLLNDESHIKVSTIKKYKLHQFTSLIFLLWMFALANSACCLISILSLLLVVLSRMFSHHV